MQALESERLDCTSIQPPIRPTNADDVHGSSADNGVEEGTDAHSAGATSTFLLPVLARRFWPRRLRLPGRFRGPGSAAGHFVVPRGRWLKLCIRARRYFDRRRGGRNSWFGEE